jgi:hypothetical protein
VDRRDHRTPYRPHFRRAGSSSNYFNVNSYTPDGRWMAYSSPSGIMALDLRSFTSRLIVRGQVSLQFVGGRTGNVYYVTGQEQTQGAIRRPPANLARPTGR